MLTSVLKKKKRREADRQMDRQAISGKVRKKLITVVAPREGSGVGRAQRKGQDLFSIYLSVLLNFELVHILSIPKKYLSQLRK